MKLKKMKRTKIAMMMIVLLALSLIACSKTSQVTFEIKADYGVLEGEKTVVLENHNGDPANVYTRTTDTNTVTFIDFPYGTYTVRIRQAGFTEYTYPSLEVKSARIAHEATLLPDVGKIIQFADREWRILERQGNRALVISQRTIGERRFDANSNVWENSEIRRYLNGEFYDTFSDVDKAKISEHTTGDKVFLLSFEEARQYFSSDRDRVASDSSGAASFWWLRSPGLITSFASRVDGDGDIHLGGNRVLSGGIRPALWLNL
ncbi:MAG: DUF6273 domain-containing protein [Candidatus Cloacimonetes bacterium]|nr:DUF6273 domain-containing protein [Candidatus Cloacimonadota bacterium]